MRTSTQLGYYPTLDDLIPTSIEKATHIISSNLERFGTGITNRHKIAMALTAGSDRRLLLSAVRNLKLRDLCLPTSSMPDDFYDIRLGQRLANKVSRKYEIIKYSLKIDEKSTKTLNTFSELPREGAQSYLMNCYAKKYVNFLVLFGHGGEIGRSLLQ